MMLMVNLNFWICAFFLLLQVAFIVIVIFLLVKVYKYMRRCFKRQSTKYILDTLTLVGRFLRWSPRVIILPLMFYLQVLCNMDIYLPSVVFLCIFSMDSFGELKCLIFIKPKLSFFSFPFFFFFFFRAVPEAYGNSQARGQIGATAAAYTIATSNPDPSHTCATACSNIGS